MRDKASLPPRKDRKGLQWLRLERQKRTLTFIPQNRRRRAGDGKRERRGGCVREIQHRPQWMKCYHSTTCLHRFHWMETMHIASWHLRSMRPPHANNPLQRVSFHSSSSQIWISIRSCMWARCLAAVGGGYRVSHWCGCGKTQNPARSRRRSLMKDSS